MQIMTKNNVPIFSFLICSCYEFELHLEWSQIMFNGNLLNKMEAFRLSQITRNYLNLLIIIRLCHKTRVVYFSAPPSFEIKKRTQTALISENTVLQCEAKGEKPIGVLWNKDNKRLDANVDPRCCFEKRFQ